MEIINGDLILTEDKIFNESLLVRGDIKGNFNLKVIGNIDARDIDVENINAENIDARDINARDINARDINAENINANDINAGDIDVGDINAENINVVDINAENINAKDIDFYAICIAYQNFKCSKITGKRTKNIFKCLDRDIEYKNN